MFFAQRLIFEYSVSGVNDLPSHVYRKKYKKCDKLL